MFPEARIIWVNLDDKKVEPLTLPPEVYRLYPGGSALAMYLILKEMKAGVDPLGPGNLLVFSVSPLTGLPISGQSRLVVTAKSPLTGAIGDSESGGFFPKDLKGNGWDAVVFQGRATHPVYLFIDGDHAELREAQGAWGMVTGDAEDAIRKDLGASDVEIAQIGPGGERMVKYACIINMCNRANGRTGMGAVMGSKNLKAVVVRKSRARRPVDPEGLRALTADVKERIEANNAVKYLGIDGTDSDLLAFSESGFLPTRNISTGYFPEGASSITGETMSRTILKERDTCYGCAVRCKRVVEVPGRAEPRYGGPEYETCATLGSYCGVTSLESIAESNQLCNMYGLDTISCGATISFAMECFEKGIITLEDTGGLDLRFGNGEAVNALIHLVAKRKGIGDILAEGSRAAAQHFGKGAEALSMSVKGNEIPAHMPQFKPSVGLIYAVNPFGADHESSEHDPAVSLPPDSPDRVRLFQIGAWKGYEDSLSLDEEKVRFAFVSQCFYSLLDTICLCNFVWGPAWQLYGPEDVVSLCKAGIGWDTSLYELMKAGERRLNMMRFFNAREGFTRKDDYLPQRFFQPLPDGPSEGVRVDEGEFKRALDLYYCIAGWDETTGNPAPGKLRELSLGWLLEQAG
ncbi:MAG: aldehyde ferredoxin oxidoreductase family protein [Bacillota bacterium]